MNHIIQLQITVLQEKIESESNRYTVAIQDGNFIDAKAIQFYIKQLQTGMDELMPYAETNSNTKPFIHKKNYL